MQDMGADAGTIAAMHEGQDGDLVTVEIVTRPPLQDFSGYPQPPYGPRGSTVEVSFVCEHSRLGCLLTPCTSRGAQTGTMAFA